MVGGITPQPRRRGRLRVAKGHSFGTAAAERGENRLIEGTAKPALSRTRRTDGERLGPGLLRDAPGDQLARGDADRLAVFGGHALRAGVDTGKEVSVFGGERGCHDHVRGFRE